MLDPKSTKRCLGGGSGGGSRRTFVLRTNPEWSTVARKPGAISEPIDSPELPLSVTVLGCDPKTDKQKVGLNSDFAQDTQWQSL